MAQNPIRTAAAATAGIVTGTLLETIVKRFGFVLNTGESLGGLDFNVGEPPLVVISADTGFVYFYDATDATTPDDGTTCLVSGNGLRYKASSGARPFLSSALTFATAPPGSPVVGDVHIVGVGTGSFAGHDDDIAFYTRRGWRFSAPEVGLSLLVDSTGSNWQFTDAGWGAFPVQLAAGSVPPSALQFPGGIVVESTLNAPPGPPTTGKFWIVGAAPTGGFSGHAADLAYWTGSAWAFLDPADGWSVFHKTFGFEVFYVSGSWLGGAGSDFQEFATPGSFTWTKPARGTKVKVQVWGAGGSGSRAGSGDPGAGGGGGAYAEWEFKLSDVSASETITVGAGGVAQTVNDSPGQAGGDSSFGSRLAAYGGAGGYGNNLSNGVGGGGGGQNGSGNTAGSGNGGAGPLAGTSATGVMQGGAVPAGFSVYGGGAGGNSATGSGGMSMFGGGGGGGGNAPKTGGNSVYGGGGGGGGASSPGAGGTSKFGGNGGAGNNTSAATAGSQPGGGGGGSATGNSGKGDGLVRVTVY